MTGTEQNTLEVEYVDKHTLSDTIYCLGIICDEKSEHIYQSYTAPLNANNQLGEAWAELSKQILEFHAKIVKQADTLQGY